MTTRARTIELQPDAFDLVVREAARRGVSPERVIDEIVRTDLGRTAGTGLHALLDRAARLRATLPPVDAVALARQARDDLEARGA